MCFITVFVIYSAQMVPVGLIKHPIFSFKFKSHGTIKDRDIELDKQ